MDERVRNPGAAFLLSQLEGHSSRLWAARLDTIGPEPREVMLFRHVALNEGGSQQAVAGAIGLPASRIVAFVDRLQANGWIERRISSRDRRTRALYLTREGRGALDRLRPSRWPPLKVCSWGPPGFADPNADQTRGT